MFVSDTVFPRRNRYQVFRWSYLRPMAWNHRSEWRWKIDTRSIDGWLVHSAHGKVEWFCPTPNRDETLSANWVGPIGRIGYIDQESVLFSGTLRDNLSFGCARLSDREIINVCTELGLDSLIRNTPNGLGGIIYEGGKNLSEDSDSASISQEFYLETREQSS